MKSKPTCFSFLYLSWIIFIKIVWYQGNLLSTLQCYFHFDNCVIKGHSWLLTNCAKKHFYADVYKQITLRIWNNGWSSLSATVSHEFKWCWSAPQISLKMTLIFIQSHKCKKKKKRKKKRNKNKRTSKQTHYHHHHHHHHHHQQQQNKETKHKTNIQTNEQTIN